MVGVACLLHKMAGARKGFVPPHRMRQGEHAELLQVCLSLCEVHSMCFHHYSFTSRHESMKLGPQSTLGIHLLPCLNGQTHAPSYMQIHSLHGYYPDENSCPIQALTTKYS